MRTNLGEVDGELGFVIPDELKWQLNVKEGTVLQVELQDGGIEFTPFVEVCDCDDIQKPPSLF